MEDSSTQENRTLIGFWNSAFALSEEEKQQMRSEDTGDWKELAPSEKLCQAACLLGKRNRVLDYGCGSGWASIIAAKSGCPDVTAADPAPNAAAAAEFTAALYGVEERVHALPVTSDWLKAVPAETYDGFICSNVLDVVPPETAGEIIREAARAVTKDAEVIIGLNYYLSPETAAEKGLDLRQGRDLYVDGVLRLVSRTDEEWEDIFSPCFTVENLDHFAWPGETAEKRRLFRLKKRN